MANIGTTLSLRRDLYSCLELPEFTEVVSMLCEDQMVPPWLENIILVALQKDVLAHIPPVDVPVKAILQPFKYPVKYFIVQMVAIDFALDKLHYPQTPLDICRLTSPILILNILFYIINILSIKYALVPVVTRNQILAAFSLEQGDRHLRLENCPPRETPTVASNEKKPPGRGRQRGNKISKPPQGRTRCPNNT
ncbi:hypothetical protein [Macropodid alphaherpesvirus 1]|uniref:Uncharacterized protein n=1 Tax=Macropodid alphaherpesvirus 1 TaxID=137443 RepID=A0A0Y0C462_9ALPH|nr:hypothetical protein [Macropodid alphaherpesvirus 1]AMB17054.1 hypothetical protein [Macropodid alphaherpesvirus 1]